MALLWRIMTVLLLALWDGSTRVLSQELGAGVNGIPAMLTPLGACRFRLWFFPRKTRYSPAEALDFLRER